MDNGLSLMGVANMLDVLWTKAIEDTLNIKKKRFKVKDVFDCSLDCTILELLC